MPSAAEPTSPLSAAVDAPSGVLVRRVDSSVPGRLWGTNTVVSHLITTKECTYKVVGSAAPRLEWRGTALFINRQPASSFPSFEEAVVELPLEAPAPASATPAPKDAAAAGGLPPAIAAAADEPVAAEAVKSAAASAPVGRSHRLVTEEIVADEEAEEPQQAQQAAGGSAGGGGSAGSVGRSSGARPAGSGRRFNLPWVAFVATGRLLAVGFVVLALRQRQRQRRG